MSESEQILSRLSALDKTFNYRNKALDGSWFDVVQGVVPVLVSAPHACMHERDGVAKMGEEYTGALALYLAEVCGCHAIVTRYKTCEDPNWQMQSKYKSAIRKLVSETGIQFLIDLHGMTHKHHMGVAIGTINGKSCDADIVLPHFIHAGFQQTTPDALPGEHEDRIDPDGVWRKLVVDHPKFTGGVVSHTVTRFAASELNIPAVQIELSSEVRVVESLATDDWPYDYRGRPEAILASVTALSNLVSTFT